MTITASGPELSVLPLGGCGEVGLNATLLICGSDVLLVDCGALLQVDRAPGVEKAVPGFEPLFVGERRLCGVVLTHGHEDHVGALPALLAELDVPVFGTPLTLAMARSRLEDRERPVAPEARRQAKGRLLEVPLGGRFVVGPFEVELIRVTHSIPESAALLVATPAGRVLFSGDFKLDHTPFDGLPTDMERLKELGRAGVELLLSDSTNAEREGTGHSEQVVAASLDRLIGESEGRVVISLVGSHLHRMAAIAGAATKHGKRVALVGRAVEEGWRMGVAHGHITADPNLLIVPERVSAHARRDVVLLASGAQGEALGGLSRIAGGNDANLRCLPGDRVIMSARTIPGNERPVRRVLNELARQGVEVVHDRQGPVHCSGHAQRDEQRELLRWVQPKNFVPIHGERTMLEAHARTAIETGVPAERVLVVEDGAPIVLAGGNIQRGPAEAVSRRPLDGAGRILDWGDIRERSKIGRAGLCVCSIAIDQSERLVGTPAITLRGAKAPAVVVAALEARVREALAQGRPQGGWEAHLQRVLRAELRSRLKSPTPELELHLLRLGA